MTRLRDLDIVIGVGEPGPHNAITDVPGVQVGHSTIVNGPDPDGGSVVRTGVTVIQPRTGRVRDEPVFAGASTLNGNGEFTGLEWVRESGLLTTPIGLTNTHSVGTVRDALVAYDVDRPEGASFWSMPTVAETFDGLMNDGYGMHVRSRHVRAALESASSGPVAEGCVGGGTGMMCHEFKGGIGTSSRVVTLGENSYTVGALVQANYGRREDLRVAGVPVGQVLSVDVVPSPVRPARPADMPPGSGSIIIIIATDAPLLPDQCRRLARRTFIGVGRVGGACADGSGDIALAFSTGNSSIPGEYSNRSAQEFTVRCLPHQSISPLLQSVSDATEEAILNALLGAETMVGRGGTVLHALTPDLLLQAMQRQTPADRPGTAPEPAE